MILEKVKGYSFGKRRNPENTTPLSSLHLAGDASILNTHGLLCKAIDTSTLSLLAYQEVLLTSTNPFLVPQGQSYTDVRVYRSKRPRLMFPLSKAIL